MVSISRMLVLILQVTACYCLMCHRGQKWVEKHNVCDDCDDGTYMPEELHNHTQCYPCAKVINNNTEYVIRVCNFKENALIGSYRHTDKNSCLSDEYYIHENSGGEKVCLMRTMPCRQGQFLVSGDKCSPCPSGTYMVDDHHNNMACNPCQQLPHNQEVDSYVAIACNITSVTDGLPVDTASFNCSHLRDVYKNCLGKDINLVDINKKGNSTDQMHAALPERNLYKILRCLLITITALFCVKYVFALIAHVTLKKSELYLSLMKYLINKQIILQICMHIGVAVTVVCILLALIVQTIDHILLIICLAALCIFAVMIIAVLFVLLCRHLSQKTNCGCEQLLQNEKTSYKCENNEIT